ncbi:rRNA pseudouridine synthase [Clostridium fermenticellae]|uniref:Pseudouridine synthase n=1 Tax=Clostridium fermenticellae TaxID=2068654 RepID=A0A386H3L3_9CLOT|nr:pseudouridine synthase [Clostridium fermenticellae]AYD40309.1 rRNA pseudouridine synthase [Clostridium fermenticellae]
MRERLQKYMAACGIASRRKCEGIILNGRVTVNGGIIKELGVKIDPQKDEIRLDGKIIKNEVSKVYIALNKPEGYLSSVSDERGRSTIIDLIDIKERIYPIGRLDYNTSGLILLTNDGDIYNRVIHPREEKNKVYLAMIEGNPDESDIKKFESGINIDGFITSNAKFKIIKNNRKSSNVKITIHEGKKRQIRKMCIKIGHPVISLKRVQIGNIKLGDLKEGEWRYLCEQEVNSLRSRK